MRMMRMESDEDEGWRRSEVDVQKSAKQSLA
jgi:hypothetical protein